MRVISLPLKKNDCPKDTQSGINFTSVAGPRDSSEADTESLVRHLTEGNCSHEYFMGFGCILPHIHNLFVLKLHVSCYKSSAI